MDFIFSPWRYTYIKDANTAIECIFCMLPLANDDRKTLIVHRAEHNYIILNAYPYTNGHVMIVPFAHVDEYRALPSAAAQEMTALCQHMEGSLRELYQPQGINLGMNIGAAAGAGVAGHIHMHMLPRWGADANFMTTIGETRVLPEALEQTYERIRSKF